MYVGLSMLRGHLYWEIAEPASEAVVQFDSGGKYPATPACYTQLLKPEQDDFGWKRIVKARRR